MTDRLADYERWHHAQVLTGDLDPAYGVLRWIADERRLDAEQRAWLCVCHVTQYHLASTLTMFGRYPTAAALPSTASAAVGLLDLPSTTERRAHRDPRKLVHHALALRDALAPAGVVRYLGHAPEGVVSWQTVTERIMQVWGNGRWAAYKLAELLQKVAGWPISAPDAGHRYSSGPRKGLNDLYGGLPEGQDDLSVRVLDAVTQGLADRLGEPDLAQVETSLCDFHSLVQGHYYLGHDIDGMLGQIAHPVLSEAHRCEALAARRAVFDPDLLGEYRGWPGIRPTLNRRYRDTGEI